MVITGDFYGIIHVINGVAQVFVTNKWPQLWVSDRVSGDRAGWKHQAARLTIACDGQAHAKSLSEWGFLWRLISSEAWSENTILNHTQSR